jgi:hypothetical protein
MDGERNELTKGDWNRMFPELVRRIQSRNDLAPLLEFDRDRYESYAGSLQQVGTERVRLVADDEEIYYAPLGD